MTAVTGLIRPLIGVQGAGNGGGGGAFPDWTIRFEMDTEGESAGSQNITDSSGYAFPVTVTGNTNIQADGSVLFDGDGDYLSIPDSDYHTVADAFDVEIEVEFLWDGDGDVQQSLMNGRDGASAEEFRLVIDGTTLTFQTFILGAQDVSIVGGTTLVASTWYNVKARRTSGVWNLLLDDVSEGSQAEGGTPSPNAGALFIGHSAFNASRQFKGRMRVVKFTKQFV